MKIKTLQVSLLKAGMLVAGAAMLSACASLAPKTPEEAVSQRAQAYWDARLKGDKAKAYTFTHPSYKQVATEKDYALQFAGTLATAAEVRKVRCEAETCEVGINFKVTPPVIGSKLKNIDMYATETWLQADGQWWIYIKP